MSDRLRLGKFLFTHTYTVTKEIREALEEAGSPDRDGLDFRLRKAGATVLNNLHTAGDDIIYKRKAAQASAEATKRQQEAEEHVQALRDLGWLSVNAQLYPPDQAAEAEAHAEALEALAADKDATEADVEADAAAYAKERAGAAILEPGDEVAG